MTVHDEPSSAIDQIEADAYSEPLFPVERGRTRGYEPRAVEAFLAQARDAFETDAAGSPFSAESVRSASFPVVRHGYQVAAVDAALSRVEDAFAARERADAIDALGPARWIDVHRGLAQEILDRLTRPRRERFARVPWIRYGYRLDEVDIVADRIAGYLAAGEPVTVEQVRAVAFRMQRGGYDELQVDAVLDAVVTVQLAVD
ncbi:MAG: DivIVA domain-containing protein [Microbacterium ginsengisoli]|uniref:DivIVA domain-containing protein n=1 Tax=Microbacterium TaxID=33882 RepID=UPI0006F948C3|nr:MULTISPECIES: DivIVA domain-containing protein [unclassified Microbacterium]KQR92964.1 MFS transporter permease [Microbacterium sp. Leaf351]KQS05663.1 MFS transporter permease [Microbacterium sp. Leaf347]MBN9197238.1 DivIVA domain-containing protein [Microbacterium ginsengisoli]